MQKTLKKELNKKQHNTKSMSKKTLMSLASKWLIRFSNKHKDDSEKVFTAWLEK